MQGWVVGLMKKERFKDLQFYSGASASVYWPRMIVLVFRSWRVRHGGHVGNSRIPRLRRRREANYHVRQGGSRRGEGLSQIADPRSNTIYHNRCTLCIATSFRTRFQRIPPHPRSVIDRLR